MSRIPQVTKENYAANLSGCWASALVIAEAPLGEMLAAAEHADVIGPFVDPTAYRAKAAALHEGHGDVACAPARPAHHREHQEAAGGAMMRVSPHGFRALWWTGLALLALLLSWARFRFDCWWLHDLGRWC